ncbi:MAG: beta-N-acetylhexosaminidase [Pseudomonadota bacterium]
MKPIIFGLQGPTLLPEEIEFFKKHQPYGFILFRRNIESREQVQALTRSLHELFLDRAIEILIDQEGGRVARIKPPIASKLYPAAASFSRMEADQGLNEVYENYKALMSELKELGITVTCAPVADLFFDEADEVIGDRSFGRDPTIVSEFCTSSLEGIEAAGGHGVIKHIPGHGRASCDSHHDLPIIETSLEELEQTDFLAFKLLCQNASVKYAMTAHIVYNALDALNPATLSKPVITYIREHLGFTGLLMTDDMSMKALRGDLDHLSRQALEAGCDLILHCNGNMEEMELVVMGVDSWRKIIMSSPHKRK